MLLLCPRLLTPPVGLDIPKFDVFKISGVLFTLFDLEADPRLKADIRESIVSLLQMLSSENLSHWLSMCKQVLLASKAEAEKSVGRKGTKGMSDHSSYLCFDVCMAM